MGGAREMMPLRAPKLPRGGVAWSCGACWQGPMSASPFFPLSLLVGSASVVRRRVGDRWEMLNTFIPSDPHTTRDYYVDVCIVGALLSVVGTGGRDDDDDAL